MIAVAKSGSITVAEIWCDDGWREIKAADARRAPHGARLRCILCHGQVAAHGNFTARNAPYFQHRKPHDGCPHLAHRFTGVASFHAQALR